MITNEEREITYPARAMLVGKKKDRLLQIRRYDVNQLSGINALPVIWINVDRNDVVHIYRLTQENTFKHVLITDYAREINAPVEELDSGLMEIWGNLAIPCMSGALLPIVAYTEEYL